MNEPMQEKEWLRDVRDLATVVAHEFNNHLNGMLLRLALLEQDAPEKLRPEIDIIRQLGTNAGRLIKQLQQFSRSQTNALQATDLNSLVKVVVERMKNEETRGHGETEKGRKIAAPPVDLLLEPDLPRILACDQDAERLLSLLLSHCVLAVKAGEGTIAIRTEAAGEKVLLKVEDNGPGISEELLPRLFEPFFSARHTVEEVEPFPALAICKAIVNRLHASIHAENRAGGGLVFVVEFTVFETGA